MDLQFVHGDKRHAEINVVQRAFAPHAPDPAPHVRDLFDVNLLAGVKGDAPFVVQNEVVAFLFVVEPRIGQQNADGAALAFPESVKNNARVGLAKMFVGNFERLLGHG